MPKQTLSRVSNHLPSSSCEFLGCGRPGHYKHTIRKRLDPNRKKSLTRQWREDVNIYSID